MQNNLYHASYLAAIFYSHLSIHFLAWAHFDTFSPFSSCLHQSVNHVWGLRFVFQNKLSHLGVSEKRIKPGHAENRVRIRYCKLLSMRHKWLHSWQFQSQCILSTIWHLIYCILWAKSARFFFSWSREICECRHDSGSWWLVYRPPDTQ